MPRLIADWEDKSAEAVCMFGFSEGEGGEVAVFRGATRGAIVSPPRGKRDFGWDPVFQPEGFDTTYAEMEADTKNSISHRGRALEKLKQHFVTEA